MDAKHHDASDAIVERVRIHAFCALSFTQRATTNLHLDRRIYRAGDLIGPDFQGIVASRPTLLVFADDDPRANFGHRCRYLLYDARTGAFEREATASFPPIGDARDERTLTAFHEPVQFSGNPNALALTPPIRRLPIFLEGERYAVLFAGMANVRHLNAMEFLYRTLVDVYAFSPSHIQALYYDGTHNSLDGPPTLWPGDGTPYRIPITGPGTRAAFEAAIDALKSKLRPRDTLLIQCNNNACWDGVPGTSFLATYPSWAKYYNADFSSKVAELPQFRHLIAMMAQCDSGGFNASLLAQSPAVATSVGAAVGEPQSVYASPDGRWDPFARDWISAQAGQDPFGASLAFNPDADGDGRIQAEEAFAYANTLRSYATTPVFSESSEDGGDITLGREYTEWAWWRDLLVEALEPYHLRLPPPEYLAHLNRLRPELAKLAMELHENSQALRNEMKAQIEAAVSAAFSLVGQG